ncbi:M23 family metallopeptidase [Corallococcus macrosporus]|uniref:M23 family metallopeptidase n=1 Tax=Corallococcus macrosporus TaxID=35 RepID=A0ABS3D4A8_9BACT|nr:M23 family metallopeptidase [Corallococcus macrosporus]MBN8226474.1 M23 family metallopeptidase [Corallococcus macrosporus]
MFARRARGLLDFTFALLCVWCAYHHTPAGALLRRAGAWAFHTRTTARPLLAYYDGVSGTAVPVPAALPAALLTRVPTSAEALAWGTHSALKALDAKAREPALALARAEGIDPESLVDPVRGPVATRRLLDALAGDFPSEEARVTAVFAGRVPARFALERVGAEGGALSLERLAKQLPPGFEGSSVGAAQALALSTALMLGWPVSESAPVTSPFGYRVHPTLRTRRMHTGVDLAVRTGTTVTAVAAGVVRRSSEDSVNGRVLVLDHGRGVTTAYCHNSELLVKAGTRVEKGQAIALSGSTGRSTGPHLHYQLELAARPVDPFGFRTALRTADGATEL